MSFIVLRKHASLSFAVTYAALINQTWLRRTQTTPLQFFGYLRRNPDDPHDHDHNGYDSWLTKLNQFGGNFQNAEMVKAFISSDEYCHRFGP